MAYQTGSVTNLTNFIDTLKTFLTTNGWTNLKDSGTPRELFFRNIDSDVVIGFKVNTNNTTYFNLLLNICNSYNAANSFYSQVGSINHYPDNSVSTNDIAPILTLHDNAINYWFFLNNRRLIVVAKASTSYVSLYLGKFLAYGSNGQYPKPFFAGANGYDINQLLSDTDAKNEAFMYQRSTKIKGLSVLKDENSNWIKIINSSAVGSVGYGMIYPTNILQSKLAKNTDNTYNLIPTILFNDTSAAGELDGVNIISGIGLSPENTLTINTEEYVIFNNIFRTTQSDFFAIKK